ncbi:MAG: M1 family metallopeptidase [Ardenticatenia bacterium]|nr:M1 family metallopeptidase [Ardenticatenia bacterium]
MEPHGGNTLGRPAAAIVMIAIFVLAVGCVLWPAGNPPLATPEPTARGVVAELPTATPAAVVTSPTVVASPDSVFVACPLEQQNAALRATSQPEWNRLPLWACYDLELSLNPEEMTYTGQARITLVNRAGRSLETLVFRLYPNAPLIYGGQLSVIDAVVGGTAVTPTLFLSDQTALRLPLADPLPAGEPVVVMLRFRGEVPVDFGGSDDVYGIFNADSERSVVTMANWYPLLAPWRDGTWYATPVLGEGDAVVSEVALYRARIMVPAGWHVVTGGTVVADRQVNGYHVYEVVTGPVRELTLVASPAYIRREATVGDVGVVHWGLEEGDVGWDEALDVARESMELFGATFGPYPYAELDVAAIPMRNAAGVEYPGLALIGADLYTGADRSFLPVAVAHEVAHQWWYAVVGNDVLQAPWQDEALTTFSSLFYFEERRPTQFTRLYKGYEQYVRRVEQEARQQGQELPTIAQPLNAFVGRERAYGAIVYLKGALFFYALRQELGDETFFRALRSYYEDYQYTIAPPGALLASFEDACGCQLDALYREWGVADGN